MRQNFRFLIEQLYRGLLTLYPPRFRATFAEEIHDIFLKILDEAQDAGNLELLSLCFSELKSLAVSIIREHWHELKSGKEGKLAVVPAFQGGGASLATVGIPGWRWVAVWTLLTTAAIIAGWLLMSVFSAILLFIFTLGTKLGITPGINGETLQFIGFFAGLALTYSTAQWLMLRNYLTRTKTWFLGTWAGFLIAGILEGIVFSTPTDIIVDPSWGPALMFLFIGLVVGVAQWMVLRKTLKNAWWILVIDVLAACSFMLSGESFTSLIELIFFLILPGLVTGIGIRILLERSQPIVGEKERGKIQATIKLPSKKWRWILAVTISIIPAFFLFSWVYAASQIELAKNRGIFATPEEAVIARNSQGWGGAKVVKVEGVRASPNRWDGSQPHVWFGVCTFYLDSIPKGWDRTQYESGSFYVHVREGWVHVPEGAFPEFIGWVMELYNLEGVNDWKLETE